MKFYFFFFLGIFILGNSKICHCERSEAISFIKPWTRLLNDGILDEIASSFVSLTPRNDGILEFSVMRSSGQARGWHKAFEF